MSVLHSILPADLRLRLYQETMQLRTERKWGYRRIARALSDAYGVNVPKGTVSNWLLGTHNPARRLHRYFEAVPSPELSYVIGAVLGDGYTTEDQGNGIVGFTNKDRKLLSHYLSCMARILGVASAGRITKCGHGVLKATIGCRLLALFLDRPLDELAPFIERYPASFVRGFFDAEGTAAVSVGQGRLHVGLSASNTDLKLLNYISWLLLDRFRLSSSIVVGRKPSLISYIRGEDVHFKKIVFRLQVHRFRDIEVFASKISFASERKKKALDEALALICAYGHKEATSYWLRNHVKIGRKWNDRRDRGAQIWNGGPGEN